MPDFTLTLTEEQANLIQEVLLEFQQSGNEASVSPKNWALTTSLRQKIAAGFTYILTEDELDLLQSIFSEFNNSYEGHSSYKTEELVRKLTVILGSCKLTSE